MSENNSYNTEMYSNETNRGYPPDNNFRPGKSQGHIWIGGFLLIIGVAYLLKRIGIDLPDFLFSWQMFLIVLGVFIGIRKNFEGVGWAIIILIGAIPLINEYFVFGEIRRFVLPIIFIGAGLFFILRPKTGKHYGELDDDGNPLPPGTTSQDYIDTTSIFGGTKRKIFSKNFKGGDMTNIFGGSEIDLSQADINGTAVLDITALFGGSTLIVPSNWNVVSQAVAILGEVKDKRLMRTLPEAGKTLILQGTVIFGGIDVKSF